VLSSRFFRNLASFAYCESQLTMGSKPCAKPLQKQRVVGQCVCLSRHSHATCSTHRLDVIQMNVQGLSSSVGNFLLQQSDQCFKPQKVLCYTVRACFHAPACLDTCESFHHLRRNGPKSRGSWLHSTEEIRSVITQQSALRD